MSLGLRAPIGTFGAQLPSGPLVIEPRTIVVAVVVGVLVAVLSAYVPPDVLPSYRRSPRMRDEVELLHAVAARAASIGAVLLCWRS